MKRLLCAALMLAVAVVAVPAQAATTGYVTVMFGRSGWVPAHACTPLPGSPTLGQAVAWLAGQNVPAVGGVVPDYTAPSGETCQKGYIQYPSWADLNELHTRFGFQAISQSQDYDNWSGLTSVQQFAANSCGTLPTFAAHGFTRANGMFAYPNNYEPAAAVQAVTSCFDFGRQYDNQPTYSTAATRYPYTVRTLSVNGGKCNDSGLSCYTAQPGTTGTRHYTLPAQIAPMLNPGPGEYGVVQFYRFVVGASTGKAGPSWNCNGPVTDHWTSAGELYCYADFQQAIGMRSRTATFTDPATVAAAWGR